ncbi:IQ motif and S7 domain-containing protein 1 [Balamuthia mandrillaris]
MARNRVSFLRLPSEVHLLVLSFLSPAELITISRTCREMAALSSDNLLWRNLFLSSAKRLQQRFINIAQPHNEEEEEEEEDGEAEEDGEEKRQQKGLEELVACISACSSSPETFFASTIFEEEEEEEEDAKVEKEKEEEAEEGEQKRLRLAQRKERRREWTASVLQQLSWKERAKALSIGIPALFNARPVLCMEGLIRAGLLRRRASEVAMFLASTLGLSNWKVEWLLKRFGFIRYKRAPYGKALVIKYIDYMDFKDLELVDALRSLVDRVPLPPESGVLDNFIQSFVKKYYLDNPTAFPNQSEDDVYVLVYAIFMLNTDAHSNMVTSKMSKASWMDHVPSFDKSVLNSIYDSITKNELRKRRVIKQGTLLVKPPGGFLSKAKKRTVALTQASLVVYDDKRNQSSMARFSLRWNTKLQHDPTEHTFALAEDTTSPPKGLFVFSELKTKKKTNKNKEKDNDDDSENSLESWINAIYEIIQLERDCFRELI